MTTTNALDAMLKNQEMTQNQYLSEAVDGLQEEITKELQSKLKASYSPNTWRYEEDRLNRIVGYLKMNIDIEKQNSAHGQKKFYEEDDLSYFISDKAISKAIEIANNPYFARIDYIEDGQKLGKTLYISDYDVSLDTVSWKNPLSKLYYDKKFNEKYVIDNKEVELERYRNITINGGKLVTLHPEQPNLEVVDTLLLEKLIEKRGDEMKALVDTLQAEQYELVCLPIENAIVVQGAAGSGKSVIALHRLSYIVYTYKQLNAKKMAIIGPHKLFLKHIENVLPELGEQDIIQTTMELYLEDLISMRVPVQNINRMILSEINDLSPNEGKKEALEEFKAYSEMRKIKGALSYKEYIEQYTNYITANLAPFIKTLSSGNYSISGIELASFFSKQTHYGNSKKSVKQFVETEIRQKANAILQIHREIASLIGEEVSHFLQRLQQHELLHVSHPAIDWQLQQVRDLHALHENIVMHSAEKNYSTIFSPEELHKISAITDDAKKETKMKDLAYDKASEVKHQLNAAKNKLKAALQQFIKLKVTEMTAHITDFFTVRVETQQELATQMKNYCALFHKQYNMEQATNLFENEVYVTKQHIEAFMKEVNETCLADIHSSWLLQKEQLVKELQQKINAEITVRFAEKLEQLLIQHYEEVAVYEIKIKGNDYNDSPLTDRHPLTFDKLFEEIDTMYSGCADELYKAIITDEYNYAEKIEKDWDHALLKKYSTIEKHDLPALYVIYKLIMPSFEKPLQYMIVDEAQDYTLFDMYVLNDLTEQIMLMGDLGQNLTPGNELHSWQQFKEVIGDFKYYELKATYRSTKQIADFSNDIIREFSEGRYNLPLITFRNGEPVQPIPRSGNAIYRSITELVNRLLKEESKRSKIAIIAKTVREAKYLYEELNHPNVKLQIGNAYAHSRVIITTPVHAKGLEFDTVILFRFSRYSKTDEHDTKLAYVAASRALHQLHVYS